MKKIYITGIAGLLGSNIAIELKEKYEISGVDIVDIEIPGITYDVYDVSDYTLLESQIIKANPDVLIHTVAIVDVEKCEENHQLSEKINAQLTRVLAEICNKNHIKMIYISTDAVFDGKDRKLYSESDEIAPINEYAKSKYKGEIYTAQYSDNLILRTNIYGLNIQNKKSFGEWVICALKDGETINMFDDIYFSPILVNDLAAIIDQCIKENVTGLYHACATGQISKYEFGKKMKAIFGIRSGKIVKVSSEIMNFKAERPKNMGMSNLKIRQKLGIKIRTPEQSIQEFYRIYMEKYHC